MIQIKTLCEGCKHWHRADARLGAKDSSGAPALGQGIKFAIGVAAKAAGPKRNNPATE